MTTEIKLNSKVTYPVTDNEGETKYLVGTLVDMNSRYATIDTGDNKTIKVGKTKIEAFGSPEIEPEYKKVYTEKDDCPHCGISLENGLMDNDHFTDDGKPSLDREFLCLACGEEFGPKVKQRRASGEIKREVDYSKYQACRSASGRKSLDNGDKIAMLLRGQPLDKAYEEASKMLGESINDLKARYNHLNVGQQRMCLGNRMRKV